MASVDNSAWDASKAWSNGADSDDPAAFYKGICAGEKSDGDPDTQAHWALPHHYHPGDAPNAAGVRNGLSRIDQTQGLKNKSAAQSHLESHMTSIQAQEKSAGMKIGRAERGLPSGQARMPVFASKLRAQMVQRDGKSFFQVEGYATVFNTPYVMYDMFGDYTEQVASTALDVSLSRSPDVSFLLNHRGMTMARTTNGTLELSKDATGLKMVALLNADRADVRDLASAINDKLIDEMSFAFMIDEDGFEWNEDYSSLTLTRIDIDRGDVSAVNYGANPYTSISARAPEIIREIRELPAGALAEAQRAINERARGVLDAAAQSHIDLHVRVAQDHARHLRELALAGVADWPAEDATDEGETAEDADSTSAERSAEQPKATGMSVDLLLKRYQALDM
jgi:HK97 family phage prohead protease